MKILDLYCGQGGASWGYGLVGFQVVGVDLHDQPRYPFEFHRGDAIEYLLAHGHEYDVIHASPPCQRYAYSTKDPSRHPDLLGPTREALIEVGKPYVIENVPGARPHMVDPIQVCGGWLGLKVRRHRLFESDMPLKGTPCLHLGRAIGVYGTGGGNNRHSRKVKNAQEAREVMEMPWADRKGCVQAIPPRYTVYLGEQIQEVLGV